jgi:hypothetical protein
MKPSIPFTQMVEMSGVAFKIVLKSVFSFTCPFRNPEPSNDSELS